MAVKQYIHCDLCGDKICKYTEKRWLDLMITIEGPKYTDAAGGIDYDQVIIHLCRDCKGTDSAAKFVEEKEKMLYKRR